VLSTDAELTCNPMVNFDGDGNRCPAAMPLVIPGVGQGLICGTGCGYQAVAWEMEGPEQLMAAHMRIVHPWQRWMDHNGVMHR
jgi:hypothetical protein